jgi:hypothetical protein
MAEARRLHAEDFGQVRSSLRCEDCRMPRPHSRARQCYITAEPGLVLLMDGYLTIVQLLAANESQADAENFEQLCVRISTGGFEDGPPWVE